MADHAITIRGLRKSYGTFEAVKGIDLDIERGEIFALLGPNGAGKTTTVEILEGYRKRTGGDVTVLGADPAHANRGWRERVGIMLQSTSSADTYLTPREAVAAAAATYPNPRDVADVIAAVGLADKADARANTLSGGQRRRLDVALAVVGQPELVFLDEPTTGFDPAARRQFWTLINSLREGGTTIVLTTHYLDEAEHLADRLAIIAGGEIVAEDTPSGLRARAGSAVVSWVESGKRINQRTETPTKALRTLLAANKGEVEGLEVRTPSLEDVYLDLIGQADQEEAS